MQPAPAFSICKRVRGCTCSRMRTSTAAEPCCYVTGPWKHGHQQATLFHTLPYPLRFPQCQASTDCLANTQVLGPDLLAQLGVGLYCVHRSVQLSNVAGRQRREPLGLAPGVVRGAPCRWVVHHREGLHGALRAGVPALDRVALRAHPRSGASSLWTCGVFTNGFTWRLTRF